MKEQLRKEVDPLQFLGNLRDGFWLEKGFRMITE